MPTVLTSRRRAFRAILAAASVSLLASAAARAEDDPLPSWNEGPPKRAVLDFVRGATTAGAPGFVPAADRIAVFDNDGTLWTEQPIYTQVRFAYDRVHALAPGHPEWKAEEPFKSILSGDRAAMLKFTVQDFERVVAATHAGMTQEEFLGIVRDWLASAKHPRYKRPYTELVFQPMLEVMRLLRSRGFKTYIATGGGQEFVRVFAERVYGVPPEQVIGSACKMTYGYARDGTPVLLRRPEVLLLDDKGGKPEGINLVIGRRPRAAFGNSTGDRQMLEWTQAGPGPRLMMLVHHDDAAREYAYGEGSPIGTVSTALMDEAKSKGWAVISMKDDWKRIFPSDP